MLKHTKQASKPALVAATFQLLVFRIGGHTFAARAEEVGGVQPWPTTTPVPSSSRFVTAVARRGNPANDGRVLRCVFPELTEERRKELVKVVHGVAEEGRVAVRNIRRDVMHDLRELKKEGDAGEDEEHRAEVELQKSMDGAIGEIDALLKGKEEEILEV